MKILSTLLLFTVGAHCQTVTSTTNEPLVLFLGASTGWYWPCKHDGIVMRREGNRPPSVANYWDGFIDLNQLDPKHKGVFNPTIKLQLTAPASVIVDEEEAFVSYVGDRFYINYYNASTSDSLDFRVQGKRGKPFPNIVQIKLNNEDICPNPGQWEWKLNKLEPKVDSDTKVFDPEDCGRQLINHQALIMNGFPSEEGEWPWHVALYKKKTANGIDYSCGGTVLTNDTVLTAAHCVTAGSNTLIPESIVLRLGQHRRLVVSSNTQEFEAQRIIVHESYDPDNLANDVALIKLKAQARFNNYVQPACLWEKDDITLSSLLGENGVVIGWGLNEKEEPSDVLTQARMPVAESLQCLETNRDFFGQFLTDSNYCAGFRNGTSVCNGDSGGGMFFKKDGRYHIRGLVSVSTTQEDREVCNPRQYVIFTDVAKYGQWIRQNLV